MKKLTYLYLSFCFICYLSSNVFSQSNSIWESKLSACEIDIPIRGTSKYDAADQKIAQKYVDIELIWLHFEKSFKKDTVINPKRVYLVSETIQDGRQIEYIIPIEDRKAGINAPIFPEWKSKKNRFYKAACFDKIYQP